MIIQNLTNEVVELRVRYFSMDHMELTQYLQPYAKVKFDKAVILNLPEVITKVKVGDVATPQEVVVEVAETPVATEPEDVQEVQEEVPETTEVVEDKFICEECGAEFASARGLSSHMNRVHNK